MADLDVEEKAGEDEDNEEGGEEGKEPLPEEDIKEEVSGNLTTQ